jgi:bacterioferritin-associated ferredoxin
MQTVAPLLNTERFIIFCGAGLEPWVYTDEPFKMDRKAVVELIATEASKLKSLHSVIGFTVGGQCRDLTKEIMTEVSTKWAHQGEPLSYEQYSLVELVLGTRVARSFVCEVA